jgi:hypothetical protein
MNIEAWVAGEVTNGREASIRLAMLESRYPPEIPALRAIADWADGICKRIGCTSTIHLPSDVITFYPVSKL